MITRIVKLPIAPQTPEGQAFEKLFVQYKKDIAAAKGCFDVSMLRSNDCYFTYSHWRNQEDLDAYRHSPIFAEVWPKTKALFNGKPEAWSCEELAHERS
ncbi:MAG: hypothetical protein RL754_534 [Bacteroidota bacterium]|jgi:quinol monooxygenase YgiN